MFIVINGSEVPAQELTFRRHGLGPRKHFGRLKLRIGMDAASFQQRIAPLVDDLRAEMVRDDTVTGTFDPLYVGATSHPTSSEFACLPETARLQLFNTYLAEDFLATFLREESPCGDCRWLVVNDGFSAMSLNDGALVLEGAVVSLSSA